MKRRDKPRRFLRVEQLESRQLLAVDHVVHISVDGLASQGFESLLGLEEVAPSGKYTNFLRLRNEGASTFNARTDYTHTVTLPNHASMLTGRPVLAPAQSPTAVYHNWTSNGQPPGGATLHSNHPDKDYVASVFDVVHDAGKSTALFASKSKLSLFEVSYNAANGALDTNPAGGDNGRDKIDTAYFLPNTAAVVDRFVSRIGDQPFNYSFLHLADPDVVGHSSGWGSAEWQSAVQVVDAGIGRILDAIAAHPKMNGSTVVVVTSDHGGKERGHGDPAELSSFEIPFFVWGPGFSGGTDLYARYAGRVVNPESSRPDYTQSNQPIRNGDSGNLALALLNLPAIPGSSINRLHPCATGNGCAPSPPPQPPQPPPVVVEARDYGDAPTPFPTLTSSNGASHLIESGFHLGSQIDADSDGQPSPQAIGDDASGNDEDGVQLLTPLVPGRLAQISVTASAGGLLQTWVDWNADGDWDDRGEQVFTNQQLVSGANQLSIEVPTLATSGTVASRFRFAQQSNLPATGPAESGEVEDYVFQIDSPQKLDTVTARDDTFVLQAGTQEFVTRVLANDDGEGQLTLIDVGTPSRGGSVRISRSGTELIYAPRAGFVGLETFSYQVRDENSAVGEANVTVEIMQPVAPTRDQVRVRLEARSASDAALDEVAVGEVFWLSMIVQDVRSSARGVEAAYVDIAMTGNVSSRGPVEHDPAFSGATSAKLVNGKIDEVGGSATSPTGDGEQSVFRVPLVAEEVGTLRFELDAADAIGHSIRLFGRQASVPFIYWITEPLQLRVVAEQEPQDPRDVDGDGLITPLDVLLIVNELNEFGPRPTNDPMNPPPRPVDVNSDGFVAAIDALLIINHLNDADAPVAAAPALPDSLLAAAILDEQTLDDLTKPLG